MADAIYVSKSLAAASANNICTTQTPTGTTALTLNGSTAAGYPVVATLDTARQVRVTCAGSDAAKTLTVYGTRDGTNQISEVISGSASSTTDSVLNFKTVTSIVPSGTFAGAVTVGTNGVGSTLWQAFDGFANPFNVAISVAVTGTVNYTVQYTYTNLNLTTGAAPTTQPTVLDDPVLAAVTASGETNFDTPIWAARVTINSGTGSLACVFQQAGV